jgi:uncharacterized membrane protein YdjX (TVP38/TMEM64 family)
VVSDVLALLDTHSLLAACGLFGVPFRVFLPGLIAGSLVYTTAYTLLGYFVGPAILTTLESAQLPFAALGSAALLVGVVVWLMRARRTLRKQAAVPLTTQAQSQRRAGAAYPVFAARLRRRRRQ